MENGYHLYDFKGTLLREEHIDRFKQWLWRPRPPTMLPKEEQKLVRKNLREYSKMFEEQDQSELDTANQAVVEARARALSEWVEWRKTVEQELQEDRRAQDLAEDGTTARDDVAEDQKDTVIEEIVEEIVDESEEIVS